MKSSNLDFATRVHDAGGIKIIARMPLARNEWAVMKDFGTLPSRNGLFNSLTQWQLYFILEEKNIDIEEINRAARGIKSEDAKQYFDNDTAWFDDPEHNDMFADDPQSDEELAKALDAFIDDDTREKLNTKMAALNDPDAGMARDAQIADELARRKEAVKEMLKDPNKVDEYKQALREKKDYQVDDTQEANKDISQANEDQKRLAEKARESTLRAIRGGKI